MADPVVKLSCSRRRKKLAGSSLRRKERLLTDRIIGHDGAAVGQDRTWTGRIRETGWVLIVAAAVMAVLVAFDGLSPLHAVLGLLLLMAAALVLPAPSSDAGARLGPGEGSRDPSAETFLSAMPNPIVILDATLSVRFFNAAASDYLPNLRVGEPMAFALRVPDVIDALRSVLESGGTRRVDYAERVPLDRAIEAQISSVPGLDGRTAFVVLLLRDFTQQRRLEEMRADFVANASHELRTPLASLLGFIETLQGPARNDLAAREKFLDIMRAQANRMSRLIDDLLSLSRIELNAHVRPDKPVDLGTIVGHVADTLAPLAKDRGVELSVLRPGAPLEVLGERDELIRVFENLVENAIKYGASGGKVDVTMAEAPRGAGRPAEAIVSVRDYGPGIASEHLPRLTERFYRVDVGQSRDKGGTGLGLAIVKHILARHRGRLTIESEPGKGAAFTVRLDRVT
jgi:two-component system phosphate regulon sensor histidine kinase PhoR